MVIQSRPILPPGYRRNRYRAFVPPRNRITVIGPGGIRRTGIAGRAVDVRVRIEYGGPSGPVIGGVLKIRPSFKRVRSFAGRSVALDGKPQVKRNASAPGEVKVQCCQCAFPRSRCIPKPKVCGTVHYVASGRVRKHHVNVVGNPPRTYCLVVEVIVQGGGATLSDVNVTDWPS